MTPLQKSIYNHILKLQPVCDLCTSKAAGSNYNQYANSVCRKLNELKYISREKGYCKHCTRTVILNRSI